MHVKRNSSPVNINIGDVDTLKATGFNFNESLKIITHGFLSSIAEEVFQINKDGLYNNEKLSTNFEFL